MSEYQKVQPVLYNIETVSKLPRDKPYGVFDLDGTLTEPGEELLMATFVRRVKIGDQLIREKLIAGFEHWKEGRKVYEPYLIEMGQFWAEMMSEAKLTRAEVMEASEKWFDHEGRNEVMRYASPMMNELGRHRFNRMMITGAPCEIAHHFASGIGIEHVFSMMAEVDSVGAYTGKMRYYHNTGLLSNKARICDEARKKCAFGIGAGDTQSDSVLAETVIHAYKHNPNDIEGRFFLMNPSADVLARMKASDRHHFDTGKIQVVERSFRLEYTMEMWRNALRGILMENEEMRPVLREVEDTMPKAEVRRIWRIVEQELQDKELKRLMQRLKGRLPEDENLQK
ncbi:MAG: HAD family hydrolase [Patescibacteria group bacterium]